MQYDKDFKYFVLDKEHLPLLQAYRDELSSLDTQLKKLRQEFLDRSNELHTNSQGALYQIWQRLANTVGVDPNTTWADGRWGIESRYLEEGFGALTFSPYPTNPLGDLIDDSLSQGESDESLSDMTPPKGTKLN